MSTGMPGGEGGSAILYWGTALAIGVVLVGIVIAIAKLSDLRRQRRQEKAVLRGAVTDALMRNAALAGLVLVPRVSIPFWRGAPARVRVSGKVRTREELDIARTTAREAARSVRSDVEIRDRLKVAPARHDRAA